MNTLTLVATLAMGGLFSFTGAADAHRYGRHASTKHEYLGFESRVDWQALDGSDLRSGRNLFPMILWPSQKAAGSPADRKMCGSRVVALMARATSSRRRFVENRGRRCAHKRFPHLIA